ncbi:MAG: hypothetical protein COC01_04800 [Bacteroidetes bacterium]|nr:MAG: hypothetical protein COC01_04800 [Bacteroidota bacterium]
MNKINAFFLLVCILNTLFYTSCRNQSESSEVKTVIIPEDTNKVKKLIELSSEFLNKDPNKALEYGFQALNSSRQFIGSSDQIVTGWAKRSAARSLSIIGIIYRNIGDNVKALDFLFQALKLKKDIEDNTGIITSLNSIGAVYLSQLNYDLAIEYFKKSLALSEKLEDREGIAVCLNNLGIVYETIGQFDKAIDYKHKSLLIEREIGDQEGIVESLNNIGVFYYLQGNLDEAIEYFQQSLEISKEIDDRQVIASSLNNIGEAYSEKGNHQIAFKYLEQSLTVSKQIGNKEYINATYLAFSETYEKIDQFKKAHKYYRLHTELKDTLFNEVKSKEIGKLEATHELEMAEMVQKRIKNEELRIKNVEIGRRNMLQYSAVLLVIVGLFIAILFSGKLRIPLRLAEGGVFFIFLLLFEFILVLLDPHIEQWTSGEPGYKLMINAALAAMIFPLHSLAENRLKRRLFKTKKIIINKPSGTGGMMVALLLGLAMLNSGFNSQQDSIIQNLKFKIQNSKEDTNHIKALLKIGKHLHYTAPDTALKHYEEALSIAIEINNKKLIANCNTYIGLIYDVKSDYPRALHYNKESLSINEQLQDKEAMARNYNNIGNIYWSQSDNSQALYYYFKSLKIEEELGDKHGISTCYNNIGNIYYYQSTYPVALSYYFRSLKIQEELGAKSIALANTYNNIGNIYANQSTYPEALTYYLKSLKINEELGNKQGIANIYNNIGIIYENQSSYSKAFDYYFKSLKIKEELSNKQGVASSYTNIGSLYTLLYKQGDSPSVGGVIGWAVQNPQKLLDTAMSYQRKALAISKELSDDFSMTSNLSGIANILMQKGKYSQAREYYNQSALLAESIEALKEESNAHLGLSDCYEKLSNHKLALDHYKQSSALKDSVFNEEKSKDLGKIEAKHEFEMAELERKRAESEKLKVESERIKRRNLLQYSAVLLVIVALFITLLFSGKLNIPVRLAEGGIFFIFLLLFEFMLVLLDPYIEQWTGGEPAYKLMINAALAAMIFPLHSLAETRLKKKLRKPL